MSNYQLYLEKARYQSPNNEQFLNEALETFFESFGSEEDTVAFLGVLTTAATLMGLALTPIVFAGALAIAKIKKSFTTDQLKSDEIEQLKFNDKEKEAIKENAPKVLEIIQKNNFKVSQKDLKKFKENLKSIE